MAQKRIPWYANGSCPTSRLIVIKTGRNAADGEWEHRLPRATLRRWRHLQELAKKRSGGRLLEISDGWSTDRPVDVQERLKKLLGKYAATPRTSSHGMVFEGQQTAAIDAGNWWWVYQNCGGYNAWQEDVRAAGFTRLPDGYQQEGEYHHIIDWNPWDDEPEFGGAPAGTVSNPIEEDDMYDDDAKKKAADRHTELMTALEKVHRAAAPFKVLSWGTGLVVYNPQNGKLWILPEGYSDLLAAIGLTGGIPFAANTEQLGFATGFLPTAIGDSGLAGDGFTAADLSAIKDAIAQAQVAVTPEQLKKLTDAVGAAARTGGEQGAVKALKDLTFVVSTA